MNLGDDGPTGQMMLLSSAESNKPETDAQAAARQVPGRMPPVFHEVFNDPMSGYPRPSLFPDGRGISVSGLHRGGFAASLAFLSNLER